MVIPHTDVCLDLFILIGGNVDEAISMISHALGNLGRISLVRFDFFFAVFIMVVVDRITQLISYRVSW